MHNSTAKLWWSAAKSAYVCRTHGMRMNHLFPSWYDCSSLRRRSPSSQAVEFTGTAWLKHSLETSFMKIPLNLSPLWQIQSKSTEPIQKVALSLFIGFQLHQHSTPELSCWTEDTAVSERREFFLKRLKWKLHCPNRSQQMKSIVCFEPSLTY